MHISILDQISIGTSGSDANFAREDFNAPKFRQIPDADQLSRGKVTRGILHHQIGATRDRQPRAGLLGE
jgi:hypothetical protein